MLYKKMKADEIKQFSKTEGPDLNSETYFQTVMRRFRKHKLAMVSFVLLLVLCGAAVFAPWIQRFP